MKAVVDPPNHEVGLSGSLEGDTRKAEAVLQELERILASRYFRSAGRSRQFLQYVVQHKLDGHVEQLKERTIGTEVFQRSPDYATGDDPVVRVQAGEVRRRLDQYYQTTPDDSPVSIKLPVGSYSPTFQWSPDTALGPQAPFSFSAPPTLQLQQTKRLARPWVIAAICLAFALASGAGFMILQRAAQKRTTMEEFWSPVFATQQPVMICLAKTVVYLPSSELYERYARAHPGAFQTGVERYNHPLPLDPKERLVWGDMAVDPEFGVSVGDAYAGVRLSGVLGKIGKPSQVRIGSNYSFEDLRNSPAVVVGAFNNRWTMQLMENLHFVFVEKNGERMIQEQVPGGRVWKPKFISSTEETSDFAIMGRLLDSQTGQFAVTVAGVTGTGTEAAAEFVSNPEYLEKGLRNPPAAWQKRNLEVVLETTVKGGAKPGQCGGVKVGQ
jgi:hypothetical protein